MFCLLPPLRKRSALLCRLPMLLLLVSFVLLADCVSCIFLLCPLSRLTMTVVLLHDFTILIYCVRWVLSVWPWLLFYWLDAIRISYVASNACHYFILILFIHANQFVRDSLSLSTIIMNAVRFAGVVLVHTKLRCLILYTFGWDLCWSLSLFNYTIYVGTVMYNYTIYVGTVTSCCYVQLYDLCWFCYVQPYIYDSLL